MVKATISTKITSSKIEQLSLRPQLRQNTEIKHKKVVHAEKFSNQVTEQILANSMMLIKILLLINKYFNIIQLIILV